MSTKWLHTKPRHKILRTSRALETGCSTHFTLVQRWEGRGRMDTGEWEWAGIPKLKIFRGFWNSKWLFYLMKLQASDYRNKRNLLYHWSKNWISTTIEISKSCLKGGRGLFKNGKEVINNKQVSAKLNAPQTSQSSLSNLIPNFNLISEPNLTCSIRETGLQGTPEVVVHGNGKDEQPRTHWELHLFYPLSHVYLQDGEVF